MSLEALPSVASVTASDKLLISSDSLGNDARASLSVLLTWLQSQLGGASGRLISQYAAPNATGFNVAMVPPTAGASLFLILTALGAYAAGTLTLPAVATCTDGQELLVTSTQSVAALTVSGNGAVVNGAPTALAANGFFRLRFDGVLKAWYRIG